MNARVPHPVRATRGSGRSTVIVASPRPLNGIAGPNRYGAWTKDSPAKSNLDRGSGRIGNLSKKKKRQD